VGKDGGDRGRGAEGARDGRKGEEVGGEGVREKND